MTIKQRYEQVKKDYKRLVELHDGDTVPDYCGAWCTNDQLDILLDCPTYKVALGMFSDLITRTFDTGFGDRQRGYVTHDKYPLSECPPRLHIPEVCEIYERNGDIIT